MLRAAVKAAKYTLAMYSMYAAIFALIELTLFGGAQLADVRRLLIVIAAISTLFVLRGPSK